MSDQAKEKKLDWTWFLFSLKGRISRKQFWIFHLIIFIGALILGIFTEPGSDVQEITRPQLMFMIWIFWPSIAVQAKRWHDRNKSAWWLMINFIPIAGPVWALIENGFLPGDPGENRYGPAPKEDH